MTNEMRTKRMHSDNIVVWFCSDHLLQVFMPISINDVRIHEFLMGLMREGKVKMVSERREIKDSDFAEQVVLVRDENKLQIQDEIVAYLASIGYRPIEEEPEV